MEDNKTSMGLEPNIAGLLCYVLGWLTGLVFFFMEKENSFVKFHAVQSIVVFGVITGIYIALSIIQGILASIFWGVGGGGFLVIISTLFGLISTLVGLASLVLWILLMFKAYQNEMFKLPIAGNIAEKQIQ